jgi:excisionase family DNA binding protein
MRFRAAMDNQSSEDRAPAVDDLLLEVSAAARLLGCSASQVRRLVSKGRLRALRTVSGQRLFRSADVEALNGAKA